MKKILIILCFCISFVYAQGYQPISWEDLEGKGEAYDDPFKKLSEEQLFNLSIVYEIENMDASEVDEYLLEDMDDAKKSLAKEKIDIKYYFEQAEIVAKKREKESKLTNATLNNKKVELSGFSLALGLNEGKMQEFLFVPFLGACIHSPPPPLNQILYVKSSKPVKVDDRYEPVTIKGTLQIKQNKSKLYLVDGEDEVESGYTFLADEIKPYKNKDQ